MTRTGLLGMKLLPRSRLVSSRPHPCLSRPFSISSCFQLRTIELQDSNYASLRTDSARLWNDIHSTAKFGQGKRYGDAPEQTGLARLALSPADKQARDWFVSTTKDLGCDVHVDKIGNIFAVRKGLDNTGPPTFVGSHLDSQPNGGRFDGVLGVMAGVEMLRVFNDNWIETEFPVGVVNWTNEEGARWKKSMMGSGVWAGVGDLETTFGLVDRQGVSVKYALVDIGYQGDVGIGDEGVKMGGHFELHIEQGKRLEAMNKVVGVVAGVQAYKWLTVTISGEEGHAGATAWQDRRDPIRAAAKLLHTLYKMANKYEGLITVGTFDIENGSVNTIPGKVSFSLDLRHQTDAGLEKWVDVVHSVAGAEIGNTLKELGCEIRMEVQEDFASKAIVFDETAMDCVRKGVGSVMGNIDEVPVLISGAGHDSVNTNLKCPTAMVFVRCKDGITHNPKEWCSQEDCKISTDVLIESVLRFDRQRKEGSIPEVTNLDQAA